MQQCWLKLISHCLGSGAALENMFAWVIVADLQNLWSHFVFLILGGILRDKIGLK
jgi:hypothetical protein